MRSLFNSAGFGLAAAALCVSGAPAHASSFPCFEDTAMQSARIHDLRIMLMVNALKCRASSPATLRKYGQLLDARGKELVYHGEQLRGAMMARYGERQGQIAFDRYETKISNYHSNIQPSREQCEDVRSFIKLAGRADDEELETLSKLVTNRAINACIVPESSAAFAAPVAAQAAPEMVDGIPTYSAPGAVPASSPEPLETVAVTPSAAVVADAKPAAAPAAEEDRLGQAINALDAAAEALRDLRVETAPAAQ